MTKVSRKSLVQLLAASLIGLVGVIITLLLLPQTASASGEEPAILGVTYSVPANEGTPITVTITASDPETDTLYYSFDWDGNGSFSDPGDIEDQGSNQASYIWTDSGVFTITVGVFDNTTRVTATTTITVTAVNDPPVVSDIPDQTINEGETFVTIDLDAYVADPDNPDSEMTWSYSGNSALTVTIDGSRIATISIPTTDWNGSETITFRATDPGSLWDEDAATFTVNNVPPTITLVTNTGPVDEGSPVTVTISATDPSDTLTYGFDWNGNGSFSDPGDIESQTSNQASYTWFDDGTYNVTVRASDGTASVTETTPIIVANRAPWNVTIGGPTTVEEGSSISLTASATDVPSDTLSYAWDIDGDGFDDGTGTTLIYTGIDGPASPTIRLRASDEDGGSTVVSHTVTVANVAPIVDAGPDQRVYEGETVNFTGVFTDSGADTHEIVWDFGDGTTATGTLTPTHVYSEPAILVVTLTVTDDDGAVGSDTMTVTVQNLPPSAEAGGPYTGTAGMPVTLSASASSDPGGGSLTFAWDLDGDGSFDDATGAVINYTWTAAGVHTVTVQATDAQLATDTDAAQVSIGPADLDHIVLSPATATILAWQSQAYTVEAFDVYNNSRGNVTAQATFSIVETGHGGTWADNVYTPGNHGDWTVRAVYTGTHVTTDEASLAVLSPVMHIEKRSDLDVVEAGATLTYTLTYSNTGNLAAVSVVITDVLDSHTSFVSATLTPSGGLPDAPVWSIGSVAPGQVGQIIITVVVDRPLPNNSELSNTAWLDSYYTTPISATSQVTVSSHPVLAITKTGSPDPVPAGQNLVYTIVITNTGNENASAVTIVEQYDPNVSFVYASRPPVPGSGNTEWTMGTLAVDTSLTLQVVVRVADTLPVGTTITNTATLDSDQTTPISITITTQALSASNLEITQVDSPDPVPAGDKLTYVIWYENTGTAPATNVVITVTYDSRVAFSGATPNPDAGNNVWVIGTLGVDEWGSIIVEVDVDTPLPSGSLLQNTVTIGSDQTSPASYVETTMVTSSPELSFSIAQQPETTIEAGAPLTYTLYYANSGNADATQVVITATLDGLAPLSSATPPPTGGGGGVWTWEIACIPGEGGSGEIVIHAQVTLPITNGTTLSFTAQLADAEGDLLEDTAQIVVTSAPALSLSNSDSVSIVYAGDVLTYTLAYANNGNEDAYNVLITDTLPSNYTQYQHCEISGGTCAYHSATNEVTFHIPVLMAQTNGQAQLVLQVDDPLPSGADSVTNRTTMAHASLSSPIVRQDIDAIGTLPDLVVSMTYEPSLFSPDRPMTYTLTYGNAGRMHAEDVVITTTLPPDTTYEGIGWSSTDGQTYTYAIGELPAGDMGNTAVFTVRHLSGTIGASEFDTVFTIAGAGSAGGDANPGDNAAEAYIGVPDLVVTSFTVAPMPLEANAPTTFTIVVKNQGTGMAWNPDSEGGFWVDLFIAPVPSYPSQRYGIDYTGIPPLAPGQQYTATIIHTFSEQQIMEITAFYVRVDNEKAEKPYGLVPESDEMNNLGGPVQPFNIIYLPLVQRRSTSMDTVPRRDSADPISLDLDRPTRIEIGYDRHRLCIIPLERFRVYQDPQEQLRIGFFLDSRHHKPTEAT
jgi:uncharacterized repeat protein (TIGR01451 family)